MNSKEIFIEYLDKKILSNNQNYSILKKNIFKDKKILIFKNAIEVNFIKNIIQRTKKLMIKPKFKKAYLDCSNIYIYNKFNKKSKVKGYYRKYSYFPWNGNNLFFKLKNFFNFKFKIDNIKNKELSQNFYNKFFYSSIQIMLYPKKKGFLKKHVDTKKKKICIFQFSTNQKFEDKNGLIIQSRTKKIVLNKWTKVGDLVIFSSNLYHLVEKSLKKEKWSIILALSKFS